MFYIMMLKDGDGFEYRVVKHGKHDAFLREGWKVLDSRETRKAAEAHLNFLFP